MFKTNKKNLLIISTVLLLNTPVIAGEIPAIDCIIEPNILVDLSSPVAGVLDTLTVDKSDEVRKGQLVATLKSDVELVNVQTSKERLFFSDIEHKRAVELYQEKVITLSDKDKAENEKKLYELDLKHAKANLDLRQIKSPIDGVIVKRYATPGEFVETKPILQIAQLDPLKIEVVSPVSNYGKIVKGMRARILPEFGDYKPLIAKVVIVDKVIDAASGTFGVRLELENKDYSVPGGLKCEVRFLPDIAIITETESENTEIIVSLDEGLMCSSIGPYKQQETLYKLLDKLDSDLSRTDLRTETESAITYLVVSENFSNSKDIDSNMQAMEIDGITDMARLKKKSGKYRIALGLYKRQSLAKNRVKALSSKGYKAYVEPKSKQENTYWADIAYRPESADVLNTELPESHRGVCNEAFRISLLK